IRRRVVHPHFELGDPGPLVARSLFLVRGTRTGRRTRRVPQTITAPDVRDPERAQPAHPGGRRGHAPERVAIIGAGPYGLSVSAHLRAAGIKTISFGQPLEFWRHQMPEGMVLRSQ